MTAFSARDLSQHLAPLRALARDLLGAGLADWQEELAGSAGETVVVTVTLGRGVAVQGTVRDDAGEAVPGALVRARAPERYPWLPARLLDDGGTVFPWPATRSDAAGYFELTGIPPGEIRLMAGDWNERANRSVRGVCQDTLQGSSGDELTWDPVLRAPRTIQVRVVDASGEVPEFFVPVSVIAEQPAPGAPGGRAEPQREPRGTYLFNDAANVPHTVGARFERNGVVTPWVYQTGVWPGGPEVVLQLPPVPRAPEPGAVTGRVVDAGGRIADRAIDVRLQSRREIRRLDVDGTSFRGAEIPPGRYLVKVVAGGDQVLVTPWFDLQPAQQLDLGDLETAPGGDLRVHVHAPDGGDPGKVNGKLGGGHDCRMLRWDGRQLVAENVTAGRHRLSLSSASWYAPPRDVDVVAGRETEVTVDVVPAVRRQITVLFPLPDLWRRGAVTIRDARDAVVYDCGEVMASVGLNPRIWLPSLPVGRYTLVAEIDGQKHTWPLAFGDPATGDDAVSVSLR